MFVGWGKFLLVISYSYDYNYDYVLGPDSRADSCITAGVKEVHIVIFL